MENIIENIKDSFNEQVKVIEKRAGIYQLYLPIYHEDGDMIDLAHQKMAHAILARVEQLSGKVRVDK